ncbi:MAG: hypothetical protein ABL997_04170 [Planctomycetota bacterium]
MPPPPALKPLPLMPRSAVVRMVAASMVAAAMLYLAVFWNPVATIDQGNLAEPEPPLVAVPQIDTSLLKQAKDATREQRLFLESEPLSHLLAQALNVSPEAARALGMPPQMVPIEALRTNISDWRGRWVFYRGKVEDLTGPRPGHPVPGYGIYEATLRLRDGSAVQFTFSQPPEKGIRQGGFARAEGFVMKLRDAAYPVELTNAPLVVGAQLRQDFEDWGPVTQIDQPTLDHIVDVQQEGDRLVPSDNSWRTIDEDQSLALWHLAAFARDTPARTKDEWRTAPALNAQEVWDGLKRNEVRRGTAMRVLGMLASVRTITAQPNPAGITEWTEAWVQVRDLGGKTIPIWLPGRVRQPLGTSVEVNSYYFRRYSYETRRGQQIWTPLFVAAALDPFVFETGRGMKEIGTYIFGAAMVLMALVYWGARRERKRSVAQEDALTDRRRKRRQKLAAATPQS